MFKIERIGGLLQKVDLRGGAKVPNESLIQEMKKSTLDDVKSEDAELDDVGKLMQDVNNRSITPSTFVSRMFDYDIVEALTVEVKNITVQTELMNNLAINNKNLRQQKLAELKEMYKDAVEQQGEFTLLEKDIDELEKKFSEKNQNFLNYKKQLVELQELIASNSELLLIFRDIYYANNSNVSYFGINMVNMGSSISDALKNISATIINTEEVSSSKITSTKPSSGKKSKSADDKPLLLHPLEILIIKKAVSFLENNKVVLVDIFERNHDGSIKEQLETHTIVLFKQIVGGSNITQFVIIDPTNSNYSKHLASSFNQARIFGQEHPNVTILVSTKELEIYKPYDNKNVGPNAFQYRDCTDIAVKIACGLMNIDIIEVGKIQSLPVILEIANQLYEKKDLENGIEQGVFFDAEEAIARIRQASDNSVRNKVNFLTIKLKHQINSIKEYTRDNNKVSEAQEKVIQSFATEYNPEQYNDAIRSFHDLYKSLEKDSMSILGGVDES